MKTRAENTQDIKKQPIANQTCQTRIPDDSTFQLADNRPDFVSQGNLQGTADNSSQVRQLRSFQEMADNSSRIEQAGLAQRVANYFNPIPIVQRRIDGWDNAVCASNTVVYHNTKQESAISLVTDGVQQVQNAWGGGILGAGFYTHTTPVGAEVYGAGRFTLAFRVSADLQGQVVPRGVIGRGIDAQDYKSQSYLTGNAFLTNEDDRNEYKFHSGDNLVFVSVRDTATGITYNSREAFINAIFQ